MATTQRVFIIGDTLASKCATSESARAICRLHDIAFALSQATQGCTSGGAEIGKLWDSINAGFKRADDENCIRRSTFAEAERIALETPVQVFNALLAEQRSEMLRYPLADEAPRRAARRDNLTRAIVNVLGIMAEVKKDTVTNPPRAGVEPCPTIRELCRESEHAAREYRAQHRFARD